MPIEQVVVALEDIVLANQEIEWLGSGYGGGAVAEGPVWWSDGGYLLFSDIGNSQRLRWAPGEGVSVFHEPTNRTNGLTRDLQGRLVACESGARRVTRLEPDGSTTVIAGSYQGRRLNRPNDVVVKSDGCIYFTDPGAPDPDLDLDFSGVYRVSQDLGTITLLIRDFVTPNGLAFSQDESILYINDSRRGHIRSFEVQPNGTLAKQSDKVFADLTGSEPGVADGMKVDIEGNIYCGGSGGLYILDPSGKKLGMVNHGATATTNLAFGGDDWKTLYFTTRDTVARIQLKIPGMPVPR